MGKLIRFYVNGKSEEVFINPWATLSQVLRKELGLKGVKVSCETGDCGACTVIVDGKAVKSCIYLAAKADGKMIQTIEGLRSEMGEWHPLQASFVEKHGLQCGFCTSGMIMASKELLDMNPSPSREEIKFHMSGNLCRCTGYQKILDAIEDAAQRLK